VLSINVKLRSVIGMAMNPKTRKNFSVDKITYISYGKTFSGSNINDNLIGQLLVKILVLCPFCSQNKSTKKQSVLI
jgi:hypothetical protein